MFNLATDEIKAKHLNYRNFQFNEFVSNALCDNIGQKNQPLASEKIEMVSFKYRKYRVRVNHTITCNQHNQTQLHRVNDLISVLYQNASTSRILEPSPQSLISSKFISSTLNFRSKKVSKKLANRCSSERNRIE